MIIRAASRISFFTTLLLTASASAAPIGADPLPTLASARVGAGRNPTIGSLQNGASGVHYIDYSGEAHLWNTATRSPEASPINLLEEIDQCSFSGSFLFCSGLYFDPTFETLEDAVRANDFTTGRRAIFRFNQQNTLKDRSLASSGPFAVVESNDGVVTLLRHRVKRCFVRPPSPLG